ncbi:MAG: hypothetical protein OEZ06_24035 [Myxococcales bacterium]|nr:hypothetical protein [Myxococcales bacterium]
MTERERLPAELSRLLTLEPLDADPGPAAPLDGAARRALIEGALANWAATGTHAAAARRPRTLAWLAAAGALCVGSAAAYYTAQPGGHFAAPPTPEDAEPLQRAPLHAPAPAPEPAPMAPPATPETQVTAEPPTAARPARAAEDLLARANRLRGQGRYRAAERAYLEVVQRAPGGPSAEVARIAAADLRLERLDNAGGALGLYRRALRRPGPLEVEALWGSARALRALGRPAEERKTLQRLLKRHPSAAPARSAQGRLDALSTTGSQGPWSK